MSLRNGESTKDRCVVDGVDSVYLTLLVTYPKAH